MVNNLASPLRVSLTKKDEFHLSDPSKVDGWSVTHLLTTKVCLYAPK